MISDISPDNFPAEESETELFEITKLDENLTAKELEELAKSDNNAIRMAVCQHPNTSPDVLVYLFDEFPHLVLEHPLLDLILLENPNFFNQLVLVEDDFNIFFNNEFPLFFLEWAANHPDARIRIDLAANNSLPEYIIEKLAKDTNERVRYAIANEYRFDFPIYIAEMLAMDESYNVRKAIANNSTINNHSSVKFPLEIIEKLAADEIDSVRAAVALNENSPVSVLEKLAFDKSDIVRQSVAENRMTSSEILEVLSKDENFSTREAVAKHSNSRWKALSNVFAEFPNHVLKLEFIQFNYEHQPNSLSELLQDNFHVFLSNYLLPDYFIDWAVKNPDCKVQIAVLMGKNHINPVYLAQLATSEVVEIRSLVADKKNIPIETLIKLAQDNNIEVRLAVAGNENASADILEKLSQDTTDEIRELVAKNPNTELLTLQKLAFFDNSEKVKFAILKNQNISKVVLQILECDCSLQIRRNANYFLQKRFDK